MLTIKDLADSLGLSTSQVRRRLSALNGIIDNHVKRGQKSKILVDSGGLELLKRLETLRKEGLTTEGAVESIKDELGENGSDNHQQATEKDELLREQINQLQSEVKYLRKKLDEKDRQIQQLLPAGKNERDSVSERVTLWQALKSWWNSEF